MSIQTNIEESQENEGIISRLKVWLGANWSGKSADGSLKAALVELLEEHENDEDDKAQPEEQKMLRKVLEFGVLEVRDIMTTRSHIQAINYNFSLHDLTKHLIEYAHTRVPVYSETLDNIKGFVHTKDVLPFLIDSNNAFNIALILRDIIFVPPSMKLSDLLVKMKNEAVHVAIVIDEYGGTDGLVTLEDIFEEIVGDIQDEHDDEDNSILKWHENGYCDVAATSKIEKLEQDLNLKLDIEDDAEAEYETIAGFILYHIDYIPNKSEIIQCKQMRFEILEADPRSIKLVRIFNNNNEL